MSTLLPNELLLEIFSRMSRVDLCSTSLASHAFCALARPLIFTTLYFRPYAFDDNVGVLCAPSGAQEEELAAKLALFSSTSITPNVRFVWVNRLTSYPGFARTKHRILDAPFVDNADTHALLKPLFAAVASFRNLRWFHAERIPFTPGAIDALSQLLGLHKLDISACTLLLPLDNISLLHVVEVVIRGGGDCGPWLACMSPAKLTSVSLSFVPHITARALAMLPVFSRVTQLKLPLAHAELPTLLPPLAAAFPAVESIEIDGFAFQATAVTYRSQPSQLFPQLIALESECEGAFAFLPRSRITDLTLRNAEANELCLALAALPPGCAEAITRLQVALDWLPGPDVPDVLAHFPALEWLALELVFYGAADRETTESILAFVTALPSLLPASLLSLRLRAEELSYGVDDDELAAEEGSPLAIPDTRGLQAALVVRCPALHAVDIYVPRLQLEWYASIGFETERMGGA
ncbi:hypothetical protein MIND_01426500 [Mycena indigotica]|uniref:F-box domain-containing protein n=1 Tax=Mycena indigotica TaxID=2126181 RepID=A0A8H6VP84_9AGAR|nr:uncharacterized protein MIND_01426500 [Mycena indigotica]KAF7288599.1 hypothetical protein MIND_01426500 [Mycena indigotica]